MYVGKLQLVGFYILMIIVQQHPLRFSTTQHGAPFVMIDLQSLVGMGHHDG